MGKRLHYSIIALFLSLAFFSSSADATPRVKQVTLEHHTAITAYIVPNLGVRLIFPFILDEADDFIPFTSQLTNQSFNYKREEGRNSLVVWITPQAGNQSGNLFITVAGYLLSIEFKTTNDMNLFYSDINFALGTAEREDLIQKGIQQRTKALEAEYKKKLADLETLADQKAIAKVGVLAMTEPTRTRIKEQTSIALPNGDRLTLFVDEAITYAPYTIFAFELSTDSDTQGVSVLDAKLFTADPTTAHTRPVDAAKDIPKRIMPKERSRGVLTTLDTTLNPKEFLKLQVLTDKGTVEAKW